MDIQINLINLINLFIPDLPCASVQIHDTGPKPVIGATGAPEVTARFPTGAESMASEIVFTA